MAGGQSGRSGRPGQAARNRVEQDPCTGPGHVQTLPRRMAETAVKPELIKSKNLRMVRQATARRTS